MVAETPIYHLPYWQATDPACFGGDCQQDNPFCDFMSIVDGQMTVFDDIVARTTTTVPFAKVLFQAEGDFSASPIQFQTELADTDDMVDLAVFAGIIPRRTGIYQISANMIFTGLSDNDISFASLCIGSLTEPTIIGTFTQVASAGYRTVAGSNVTADASTLWQFTDSSPSPRGIYITYNAAFVNVATVSLTATWVRDVI